LLLRIAFGNTPAFNQSGNLFFYWMHALYGTNVYDILTPNTNDVKFPLFTIIYLPRQ